MIRRIQQAAHAALLALLVAVGGTPLRAQDPPPPAPGDVPAEPVDAPPIPQTFDWWTETGVPSVTPWGQPVDTAATRMILSWTTMPEYTTELVDHLPVTPGVVSPQEHFGVPIGEPGRLHSVDEIHGYFDALAASTPRVGFHRLGETEEGRRLGVVTVASEENMARLEEVRAAMNALADPRGTSREEAERIIAEMPAVYAFYAGLHSPETGPPEMVMEMAWRLASSDDPLIREIRDEVVVLIVPVAEPDGRDRVVEWHRRYNADTWDTDDRVPGPPYWGHYIFHDNNRDGLQLSARLTQELVALFESWRYPIGHDLHESVPYLYVSTGTGPYNPTVDAITISEWQWMSNFEVTRLTSAGLPGVWTHAFYTGWYPGYLLWVTNTRNAVGRFYETFGSSVPNTMVRELGTGSTSIEWYRPNPPRDSTIWSLRNNTNYMQSGALSALSLVARNRADFLRNYWRKANRSLESGRDEAPYAYVVPVDQPRRANAAAMLDLIRRQGIEVHRATEDGTFAVLGEDDLQWLPEGGEERGDVEEREDGAEGRDGEAGAPAATVRVRPGDYVVRMDQPYRNFALTLMQLQAFPEDAPRPYDDVAWTFPLMSNVRSYAVADRGVQDLRMEPVDGPVRIPGHVRTVDRSRRGGGAWLVPARASAHAYTARLALGGLPVRVTRDSLDLGGDGTVPPGAWVLDEADWSEADAEAWAAAHGAEVLRVRSNRLDGVATHAMDLPRIALLHTWSRTQDEGWARYTLDQAGVEYAYIGEDEVGDIDLRSRFDVVLFPHQGSGASARRIFEGIDPEWGPLAYTRTPEYPSHGIPDESEDITGGMGLEGLMALRDFVRGGGTLVAIGSAATVPVDFAFLRDVSMRDAGTAFIPGSIVRGEVADPSNPLAYGYEGTVPLYHQFGPYFSVRDDDPEADATDEPENDVRVALRYADSDLLLSGLARSAGDLGGQPAVLAAPMGEGWIVLTGFDAFHRHQTHGNHALIWNALMNWNDLAREAGR